MQRFPGGLAGHTAAGPNNGITGEGLHFAGNMSMLGNLSAPHIVGAEAPCARDAP